MEQRGRFGGLNLFPRKTRTPLKRYKVHATLPGKSKRKITLIVRARSKKNACFFALQDYPGVVAAKVVAILGKSREIDDL